MPMIGKTMNGDRKVFFKMMPDGSRVEIKKTKDGWKEVGPLPPIDRKLVHLKNKIAAAKQRIANPDKQIEIDEDYDLNADKAKLAALETELENF